MLRRPARASGGLPAMLRRAGRAQFRVAPDHDGSFACPPGGVPHLIVSDFPVLSLIGGQEFIQGLQPPVMIGFQPEGVIDPGADALGAAARDSLLCHSYQLGVHRCREPPLHSHTFMLHPAYDCRNILLPDLVLWNLTRSTRATPPVSRGMHPVAGYSARRVLPPSAVTFTSVIVAHLGPAVISGLGAPYRTCGHHPATSVDATTLSSRIRPEVNARRAAVRSGQGCLGGHGVSRADPGRSGRLP